jgi:hypothetical protein
LRYGLRCGHCGVAEVDAGGELTVDHYHPLSAGGNDTDENLVYACSRCNLYKGDFWPTAPDLAHGRRVLHPLQNNLAQHLRLQEQTGELEPLTETGRFHIVLLRLNRPALVAYRLHRRLAGLLAAKQRLLEVENQQLRSLLAAQERYIAELKRLLGLHPEGSAEESVPQADPGDPRLNP